MKRTVDKRNASTIESQLAKRIFWELERRNGCNPDAKKILQLVAESHQDLDLLWQIAQAAAQAIVTFEGLSISERK